VSERGHATDGVPSRLADNLRRCTGDVIGADRQSQAFVSTRFEPETRHTIGAASARNTSDFTI